MNGDYQKTPVGLSLARIAMEAVATALQQSGKALPCSVVSVSGQFVTVKFEVNPGTFTIPNVTIPIATSKYDWLPVQVGDTGVTQPADVHLAGINGTGGGTPNLVQSANLTALVFVPVAVKQWAVPDATQRVVQGPGGALIQDTGAASKVDVTPTTVTITAADSVTLQVGGQSIVITASAITIGGIVWATHQHTLVSTGTDDSGPPLV